jgi:hypothetical protein
MDFPLPLTLVLMMTEDADRYAARAAESSPASREIIAPARSNPTSGTFPASAPSERAVGQQAERVA